MKLDGSIPIGKRLFRPLAASIRSKSKPLWKDNLWAPHSCTQSSAKRPRPFGSRFSGTGLPCVLIPIASLPFLGIWGQNAAVANSHKQVHSILIAQMEWSRLNAFKRPCPEVHGRWRILSDFGPLYFPSRFGSRLRHCPNGEVRLNYRIVINGMKSLVRPDTRPSRRRRYTQT